jgi:hypothetical protein
MKSKNNKESAEIPFVNILLEDAQFGFDLFVTQFEQTWLQRVGPVRDDGFFGIIVDGMTLGCVLIPTPIADTALIKSAVDNLLWSEAELQIPRHSARLEVAIARVKDPVAAHVLLSKVVYNMLHQRNVIGAYIPPALFEPAYYIKCAEVLLANKLPTELWVHIHSIGREKEEGFTFYTSGMVRFGKKEFEIVKTKNNYLDSYYMLKELLQHTIENNVAFKNGDTVGPEGGKSYLSISDGVNIKGESIKIRLPVIVEEP